MLVFAKQPLQVISIENQNFYGRDFGYPPQDVSFRFFKKYKDAFEEATYREQDLSRIFKKPCNFVIAFKYSELKHFPEKTLDKIAKWIGVKPYQKGFSTKRKVKIIQYALSRESAIPFYKQ